MTCGCGCGQPTKLAPRSRFAAGWVKGRPLRFLRGHGFACNPSALADLLAWSIEVPRPSLHSLARRFAETHGRRISHETVRLYLLRHRDAAGDAAVAGAVVEAERGDETPAWQILRTAKGGDGAALGPANKSNRPHRWGVPYSEMPENQAACYQMARRSRRRRRRPC